MKDRKKKDRKKKERKFIYLLPATYIVIKMTAGTYICTVYG